jgi:hypothetical protein
LKFIFVAKLTQKVQSLCRHDEAAWQSTEVAGLAVQEVSLDRPGRRLIVIRQRVRARPQAGGKMLVEMAGYRFQALVSNLPPSLDALSVWRRYNGRADLENRIKELGEQFGIKRLCVLLPRRLGQLEKCALNTRRWRRCGAGRAANPHSNWPCAGRPTATGGAKCCANLPLHTTAMQWDHCRLEREKPPHLCVLN